MRHALLLLVLILFGFAPLSPATATASDDVWVHVDEDPDVYSLSAAYPNPFNPQTSFSLTTHERQEITVEVFNLLGARVKHLYSGTMQAGETRSFTFAADDLPSGIYLYRVQGESFTATRQMTLLK